jgi:ATP-dependent DNA helicase RecG
LPPTKTTSDRSSFWQQKVWKFLRDEIALGRQIYIVYPLIQESEKMDFKLITVTKDLRDFPSLSILHFVLHERWNLQTKIWNETFSERKTNIMVATTVIEVGVNVPMPRMIIESRGNACGRRPTS